MKSKVGILIITYNQPNLLRLQVDCLRKYIKDQFDVVVIDNSTNPEAIESIRYHAGDLGCKYIKTHAASQNGSRSHSFAANLAYEKFRYDYEYFAFFDHDLFVVKPFSIIDTLEGKVMAGLGQVGKDSGKTYFWPGCVMWHNITGIINLIDFSPSSEYKLDTGGNLYGVIDVFGEQSCVFFDEKYFENHEFNKGTQNFYSMIHKETFLHAQNGSNWKAQEHHEERMNSIINIVTDKITKKI